jgi:predicted metal-dependent TIM-barrel fold hydrolase
VGLAREVIAGIEDYVDHPRCVAIGEIGFNNITDNEETVFVEQLELAKRKAVPVIIHLPHFHKPEGVARMMPILRDMAIPEDMILIDHNTEDTMPLLRGTGYYLGLTVYPISKLTPERVSNIIRTHGHERVLVNGSADWGVSDPLSLVKVVDYMRTDGHPDETIQSLVFHTANAFYAHSPKWKPELDLEPVDPREFQR